MFPVNLCTLCRLFADKVVQTNVIQIQDINQQRSREISSSPVLPISRKCSKCYKLLPLSFHNERMDSGCELADPFERETPSPSDDGLGNSSENEPLKVDEIMGFVDDNESVCSLTLIGKCKKKIFAKNHHEMVGCKRRKISYSQSNNQVDQVSFFNDPLLKLHPKVHIFKMPDFMIHCAAPASALDEMYSLLSNKYFSKDFVRRHIPRSEIDNETIPGSQVPLELKSTNIEEILLEDTIIETEQNISCEENDSIIHLEDNQENELSDKKLLFGQRRNCFRTLTCDDGDSDKIGQKEENEDQLIHQGSNDKPAVTRILIEEDLERSTKLAMIRETQRMLRISDQEKCYQQILSEIAKNRDEPNLILDIDTKTKKVRVEVNSMLSKELKPHQREGIKFMYNATIESICKIKEPGSGCILAHDLGSGKSLQVITFIQTLLSNCLTKDYMKKILITAPVSSLKCWIDEFDKWVTKKGLKSFCLYVISNEFETNGRLALIDDWGKKGGVLIIGHNLFIANLKPFRKNSQADKALVHHLANPGPDMIIIDEAHLLKSPTSQIYQAVSKVRTKRKILVTGTPLQNILKEYYFMINLIKPRLLGSKREFTNRFENMIENPGFNLSEDDVQLMRQQAYELYALVSGSIQRFNPLKLYLKSKHEFVIIIRPLELMSCMYSFYLDCVSQQHHLHDYTNLRLCVNHPALLQLRKNKSSKNEKIPSVAIPVDNGWFQPFLKSDDWADIGLSGKMVILFKLLKSCIAVGDKLVVVSQSIETLDLIESHLEANWRLKMNRDFFRIDGSNKKLKYTQEFNDPDAKFSRLLLLSTRSSSNNLTGANRIVIFDVSWNPFDDIQAISSVYRFGQTKPVYVYRLVTKDTMEEVVLRQQSKKLGMVSLVVDNQHLLNPSQTSGQSEYYSVRPKGEYDFWCCNVANDRLLTDIINRDNEVILHAFEVNSLLEDNFEE